MVVMLLLVIVNPLRAAYRFNAICPISSWCMNAALARRLARAAFMHHDDKGHSAVKHYAAIKGLFLVSGRSHVFVSTYICVYVVEKCM